MFKSINTKILTSQIGLVLLLSIALGCSTYFLMIKSLTRCQERNLTFITKYYVEHLISHINDKKNQFKKIAMGEAILAYSLEYEEPALLQYFDSVMADFPVLSYINEDGFEEVTLVKSERLEAFPDISKTILFEEATWQPNKVFSMFSIPETGAVSACAACMQFAFCRKSYFGEFEGIIAGKIPIPDLIREIGEFKFDKTGFLMIIDDQGNVLSHIEKKNILKKVVVEGTHSEEILAQITAMQSGFGRATIMDIDGYVAFTPIEGANWAMIATLPYEEFMSAPTTFKNTVLAVSSIVLFMGILISLVTAKGITKPVRRLVIASGRLAKGDLSQRVTLGLKDEIGELGHAFNKMAADLQETMTSRDKEITERKEVEQALIKSEKSYRTLFEDSRDAIYMTARESGFTDVNQAALNLFGYSREEMIGLDPQKIYLSVADRKQFQEQVEQNGSVGDYAIRFCKKNGAVMDCLLTASVRRGDDGSILGYQGIIRNVTERKRLEAQLQQAQKMEAVGTLAGGIAHDFNNLLTGIQGNVSLMLMNKESTAGYCERLDTIEKQIRKGARLTAHLLGYARKGKYEIKPVDLNKLVKETAETFGRTRKEITIIQELTEDVPTIEADPGQIEQVLLNLFVNAADAMPGGGNLTIKTKNVTDRDMMEKAYNVKTGNYVQLTIADTGIGMDQKTMTRIFDPFFTTKVKGRGTGLGLASVYGIIKSHGAYIDVESKEGQGTTFNIYLSTSDKKIQPVVKKSVQIIKGSETVLLVEDEKVVLDVGRELLKFMGYRVLTAKDGKEALTVYLKNPGQIDIIILDMIMPTMGGGETYDQLKKINPDVKVLLASGYSIDGEAAEILARGCNGFIQKPFNVEDLSLNLRTILG
ncbi:MAG: PAS domain S-box protein [Proteobacteria bacterium]|nr:PAS domain S-box protein [Pseudomonadota bacterium]